VREKLRESLQKKLEPEGEGAAQRVSTEAFTPIASDVVIVNDTPDNIAVFRLEVLNQTFAESNPPSTKKSKPETLVREAMERQLPIYRYMHRINLYPGKFDKVIGI
jgi:hypothetical protein